MPFLTFYTPTYKRPAALEKCKASVLAQSDPDWEHVIIPDEIGIGIDGMYGAIQEHAHKCSGNYVTVLSDDDIITDVDYVAELKKLVEIEHHPPVVIVGVAKHGRILPDFWEKPPRVGHIDLLCIVVRRDIWLSYAHAWGRRYEGDGDFAEYLWKIGLRFAWLDRVIGTAQRVSAGRPE